MTDIRGLKKNMGTYVNVPRLYRRLTAGDVSTAVALEALPQFIDMEHRMWMHLNVLHLQVIMPASVTAYDIEIWGTVDESAVIPSPVPDPLGGERWAKIDGVTGLTRSSVKSLFNVLPGKIKVMITNVAGDFSGGEGYILECGTA